MIHTAYIPKSLSEEIVIFSLGRMAFSLKDLITFAAFAGFFLMFTFAVNSWFMIPYILFAFVVSTYMTLPASVTNPGKRNWEALYLYLLKNRSTVFSLNLRKEVGVDVLNSIVIHEVKEEESDHVG